MRLFAAAGLSVASVTVTLLAAASVMATPASHTAFESTRHGSTVISLVGKTTQSALIRQRPGIDAQGDHNVFAADLFDERGNNVGHDGGECVVTRLARGEAICDIDFQLAQGQITTSGLIRGFLTHHPFSFDLSVTGGTGAFGQVRGTVHCDAVNPTETRVTIDLKY